MRIRTRIAAPAMLLVWTAAGSSPGAAAEPDVDSLLAERGCTSCHALNDWKVGPPLKTIAKKYRADPEAGQKRIVSALKDGVGHPKAKLNDDELQAIVKWVLAP